MKKAFVLFELMNAMVLTAKEAKARGYQVVALNHDPLRDSGPFAVPPDLVDELVPVGSWSDRAALDRLIDDLLGRYEVAGTYAAFEAVLPTEAALRERAGLPTTAVADVRVLLDKAEVRRRLHAAGLTELRSTTLTEAMTWTSWPWDGDAVLKPVHGTGSALCFTVSSLDELHAAAGLAAEAAVVNPLMRDYIVERGEFVLEEKAQGELLSVECLILRGEVHVIGLTARYTLAADPVVEQGVFFPYDHPRRTDIETKVRALHQELRVGHGSTHVEVMVPEQGEVELIDFNPRFAGVGITVCVSEAFGLRYESVLTDLGCGQDPDLSLLKPTRSAIEWLVLPPPELRTLESITFPPDAVAPRVSRPIGTALTGRSDQLDVVCFFIIVGDTPSATHRRAMQARAETLINGVPVGDRPEIAVAFSPYVGQDPPAPTAPPHRAGA